MRRFVAVLLAAAAIGCGSPASSVPAAMPTWTPPPDWVTVTNVEGSIQLTLPPSIRVGDRQGAIFANEAPPPGTSEIPIQLWAEGPILDGAPGAADDLAAWIDRRLPSPVRGSPIVTRISLPAGSGIRYERLDAAGTPNEWRIVAFVIETQRGIGWLMIDGPPDEWAERAEILERIPFLFRIR